MSVADGMRDLQDRLRDSGWRIKWIPWQEAGSPEMVYNTPLTLATGFGGAALFIVSVYLLMTRHAPGPSLALGAFGLAAIVLGRVYAAFHKQAGWVEVAARCLDREVRSCQGAKGSVVWEYRLLCSFTHSGRECRVTPEASHVMAFGSEESVRVFLDERIRPDGCCALWVDPANPLHAVFDRKQRI